MNAHHLLTAASSDNYSVKMTLISHLSSDLQLNTPQRIVKYVKLPHTDLASWLLLGSVSLATKLDCSFAAFPDVFQVFSLLSKSVKLKKELLI